jgi:hypothetical protein
MNSVVLFFSDAAKISDFLMEACITSADASTRQLLIKGKLSAAQIKLAKTKYDAIPYALEKWEILDSWFHSHHKKVNPGFYTNSVWPRTPWMHYRNIPKPFPFSGKESLDD